MKIYIAGKITGNPHYIEQFANAERYLQSLGYEVVNPVSKEEGNAYKWYIDEGLKKLMCCDAIYLLENWKESKGAKLEKHYAETVELDVLYQNMKFKVGDKVKTECGIGEVIAVEKSDFPYLVGIKGLEGHSGGEFFAEIAKKRNYEGQCDWFSEEELELADGGKTMKKNELKTGMLVVTRNERKLIFLKDYETTHYGKGVFSNGSTVMGLGGYEENLCHHSLYRYNIIEIYEPKDDGYVLSDDLSNYKLIWKREEAPTITTAEKVILESLPKIYKWIVRHPSDALFIHADKPEKINSVLRIATKLPFSHLFKMVKWEDDKPWLIEDLLNLEVKDE